MLDIFIEVAFRGVCFPFGWPVVKLATLGRYPSSGAWLAHTPEAEWTCAAGLVVLAVAGMFLMGQFMID
ncbi:hypothetical protein NTD84_01380 [Pseudomonas sp. 14P_8.1_Bac3]|uniref:hypothetical protein n=1 Tax=Pseudomonas sp. 14P_8.1_Bac3 TaxID=2971621 RepID=UPI0021CA431E|nr:hypothetical protein [Pseudomonas sp. 14P_8.1_Bac3]MCU1758374.1 hypothetical protein [Pseudomonas sp. 14P_8.1_Bac3]